tara:strand:+ start:537 stop:971 length:435 start_codon:yes stop_codon:yes gene_type:complete
MSFLNRFSFYFIGVLFGCLILYVSLKGRDKPLSFNYFPNSRVKSHLINSDILISIETLCKVNCMNLDTMLLDHYILDGKIDFKKSEIRGFDVKTYYLFYEINNKDVHFFKFQTNGDKVELVDLFISPIPPNINQSWHVNCPDCF